MNVKFANNTSKWQIEFNSEFKGLISALWTDKQRLCSFHTMICEVHTGTAVLLKRKHLSVPKIESRINRPEA
jgi:hypothetical protein